MGDVAPVLALRLASVVLSGALIGIATTWPVLVYPALSNTLGFSAHDRFSFWTSYHRRVTPITSLLLPLLTVTLSLSALFAPSLAGLAPNSDKAGSLDLVAFVKSSRKSLFIVAAILTLAHRPYNFTFLVPRQDVLFEYERHHATGYGARSFSPVTSDEDDRDDYGAYEGFDATEKTPLHTRHLVDTDQVVQELTTFQFGTVVLSSLTFVLTLVELVCV
ncbi:hypothetical protein JCM11491_006632 [Sporobolomyces phaffii]